jgi:hypothetical protein
MGDCSSASQNLRIATAAALGKQQKPRRRERRRLTAEAFGRVEFGGGTPAEVALTDPGNPCGRRIEPTHWQQSSGFARNGTSDRHRLRRFALGSKYVMLPGFAQFDEEIPDKFEAGGIKLLRNSAATLRIWLRCMSWQQPDQRNSGRPRLRAHRWRKF